MFSSPNSPPIVGGPIGLVGSKGVGSSPLVKRPSAAFKHFLRLIVDLLLRTFSPTCFPLLSSLERFPSEQETQGEVIGVWLVTRGEGKVFTGGMLCIHTYDEEERGTPAGVREGEVGGRERSHRGVLSSSPLWDAPSLFACFV